MSNPSGAPACDDGFPCLGLHGPHRLNTSLIMDAEKWKRMSDCWLWKNESNGLDTVRGREVTEAIQPSNQQAGLMMKYTGPFQ